MVLQIASTTVVLPWLSCWTKKCCNFTFQSAIETQKQASSCQDPLTGDILIDQGGFGSVWRSTWNGKQVAVKVSREYYKKVWQRETQIYHVLQTIQHENLLVFIAALQFDNYNFLLTEFHERGSLYNYLKNHMLDRSDALKICTSILSGVEFLHSEIPGRNGKPAIAHRDIKSQNILMKSNGECAISDFGAAICLSGSNKLIPCTEAGTLRYTAPEFLMKLRMAREVAFLMADMYSIGLVLWEACKRCTTRGKLKRSKVEPFELPYSDFVPVNPSRNDMQKILWKYKLRPALPECWKTDKILCALGNLMSECWNDNPVLRPTASNAKLSATNLNRLRRSRRSKTLRLRN